MKILLLLTLVFSLGCGKVTTNPSEIVSRHVEAIGGQANLDQIQTLRITSKAVLKDGREKLFISESMKPDSFRVENVMNGRSDIFVSSGHVAYVKQAIYGAGKTVKYEGEEAVALRCLANFGTYVTSFIPASKLRYVGPEKVDGRNCYRLSGHVSNLTMDYFIDMQNFYLVQMRSQADGEKYLTIKTYRDYFRVGGVVFAKTTISETIGISKDPEVNTNLVEVNIQFPLGRFSSPE